MEALGICSCWDAAAGGRDGGDESADAAVAMLFAAVGRSCWGAIRRRRICGRCCYHAICSCWGAAAGERYGGDESADAAVAMLVAAAGERYGGDEVADGAVTMRIGDWGRGRLGDSEETALRTVVVERGLRGPDFGPLIF